MLGFHVSVYRQADSGVSPATFESAEGDRLAVWQTDIWGLDWLENLAKAGQAISLGGNGYPLRYTALASYITPQLAGEPPRARRVWAREVGDIVNEKWVGRTLIDRALVAACPPDEWLLIEAWDES